VTAKLFAIVVVPVPAPMLTAVAAPPMLRVVTPELSKLKVPTEDVRSPPLIAISPPAVTFPVKAIFKAYCACKKHDPSFE
jgi:hypothetical protein